MNCDCGAPSEEGTVRICANAADYREQLRAALAEKEQLLGALKEIAALCWDYAPLGSGGAKQSYLVALNALRSARQTAGAVLSRNKEATP